MVFVYIRCIRVGGLRIHLLHQQRLSGKVIRSCYTSARSESSAANGVARPTGESEEFVGFRIQLRVFVSGGTDLLPIRIAGESVSESNKASQAQIELGDRKLDHRHVTSLSLHDVSKACDVSINGFTVIDKCAFNELTLETCKSTMFPYNRYKTEQRMNLNMLTSFIAIDFGGEQRSTVVAAASRLTQPSHFTTAVISCYRLHLFDPSFSASRCSINAVDSLNTICVGPD